MYFKKIKENYKLKRNYLEYIAKYKDSDMKKNNNDYDQLDLITKKLKVLDFKDKVSETLIDFHLYLNAKIFTKMNDIYESYLLHAKKKKI